MPEIILTKDPNDILICFHCKNSKSQGLFVQAYLRKKYPHFICKDCHYSERRKHYQEDLEFRKDTIQRCLNYQRTYKNEVNKSHNEWRKKHNDRLRVKQREYYHLHPIAKAAHRKIKRLKEAGLLCSQPCIECGDTKVHAHHPDYKKQEKVIWLCPLHHREIHQCQ